MPRSAARIPARIPAREIEFRFSRSSGPGGQNVNKRDTRVEAWFDIAASRALSRTQKTRALARLGSRVDASGRVRVVSGAARTQTANRAAAHARLNTLIAEAVRPPPAPRRPTKPSRGANERRIAEKKARGALKRDRRARADD